MMSKTHLRYLLHRTLNPVRLCEDRVAYEKSDGLRQEAENAVVFASFNTTGWKTEKSGY